MGGGDGFRDLYVYSFTFLFINIVGDVFSLVFTVLGILYAHFERLVVSYVQDYLFFVDLDHSPYLKSYKYLAELIGTKSLI